MAREPVPPPGKCPIWVESRDTQAIPFIKRSKFQLKAILDVKMGMAYGAKEFVSRSVLPSQGRRM
jgi:hypothetical protein